MLELEIDGHHFEVTERAGVPGQYDFNWITGPVPGFGFTCATSDGSSMTDPQLEDEARDFIPRMQSGK